MANVICWTSLIIYVLTVIGLSNGAAFFAIGNDLFEDEIENFLQVRMIEKITFKYLCLKRIFTDIDFGLHLSGQSTSLVFTYYGITTSETVNTLNKF